MAALTVLRLACVPRSLPRHALSHCGGSRTRRYISTLQPSRLTDRDFVDLSGKEWVSLKGRPVPFFNNNRKCVPFPADTQGFFYFIPGPAYAPIAGELRFRTTSGSDPASFANGEDLQEPNRPVPWHVPLVNVLKSPNVRWDGVRNLLLKVDGTIDESLFVGLATTKFAKASETRTIHSLGQPFVFDLSRRLLGFRVASGNVLSDLVKILPYFDARAHVMQTPYTGQVKCCFEVAVIDERKCLVLRVLQIVDSVRPRDPDYDGFLPSPVAGELVSRSGGSVWAHHPHEANSSFQALRHLLDQDTSTGYVRRAQSLKADESKKLRRCIRNLDPNRLDPSDWMDLSHRGQLFLLMLDEVSGAQGMFQINHYFPVPQDEAPLSYPQGTTGFFYVHAPDRAHPVATYLRFRVVSERDSQAFAAGHDLLTPDGAVWSRWIPVLLRNPIHRRCGILANILTRQKLVAPETIDFWLNELVAKRDFHTPIVYPGSESFILDLSLRSQSLNLGCDKYLVTTQVRNPFVTRESPGKALYTGHAVVKLIEDAQHQRYDMEMVKILQHKPVYGTKLRELEEGAVFRFPSGKAVWAAARRLRRKAGLNPASVEDRVEL